MPRPRLSMEARFSDKYIPEPNSGCWLWIGALNDSGYGVIQMARPRPLGESAFVRAHRLSYEMHNGPITEELHVLHSCDLPCCVNPDHLFLGTDQDNSDDKMRKGRDRKDPRRGITHGMTRLSEDQVREIRACRDRLIDISEQYGISISHAHRIKTRQSWRCLA